jgi:hypothetical protein
MGCDIHAVIEFEVSNRILEFTDGPIFIQRDYDLFSALAGVRSVDGFRPLHPPRGLPGNYGEAVGRLFFDLIVPDGEENHPWYPGVNCVNRSFAERCLAQGHSFYDRSGRCISNPDWHNPSWLTVTEISTALAHAGLSIVEREASFRAVIAAMTELARKHGPDGVRLVFWFDN